MLSVLDQDLRTETSVWYHGPGQSACLFSWIQYSQDACHSFQPGGDRLLAQVQVARALCAAHSTCMQGFRNLLRMIQVEQPSKGTDSIWIPALD